MVKERVSNKASWKHFWSSEKKTADRSRFGPELTEAEIDGSVEELLILEFFNQTIILLGLAGYKMIITNSALRASLVIYYFVSSAPS